MHPVLRVGQLVCLQRRPEAGHDLSEDGKDCELACMCVLTSLTTYAPIPSLPPPPGQAKICKDPLAIYKHMLENNIGTGFALIYDTYAVALSERGKLDEAVKLVKQGLAQKAHPIKKLQKRLESLKKPSEPTKGAAVSSTITTTGAKKERPVASSTWLDEQV